MNRFTENRTGVRFRRFTDTVCRQCACRQQRHYHDDCHHHSQQSFFHVDSPFHCRIPFRGTVASVLRIAPPPSDCSRRDSIYFASISILLYTPSSELSIVFSIFCHFDQNKAPHFSTFPAQQQKTGKCTHPPVFTAFMVTISLLYLITASSSPAFTAVFSAASSLSTRPAMRATTEVSIFIASMISST